MAYLHGLDDLDAGLSADQLAEIAAATAAAAAGGAPDPFAGMTDSQKAAALLAIATGQPVVGVDVGAPAPAKAGMPWLLIGGVAVAAALLLLKNKR